MSRVAPAVGLLLLLLVARPASAGDDVRYGASVAYGAAFADNVGATGSVDYRRWGFVSGVGYTRYLTVLAGPRVRFDLGRADLELALLYTLDGTTAGDHALWMHLVTARVAAIAPITDRVFVRADLAVTRYPLAARATQGDTSHDVPVSSLDASWFLPGLGVGLRL